MHVRRAVWGGLAMAAVMLLVNTRNHLYFAAPVSRTTATGSYGRLFGFKQGTVFYFGGNEHPPATWELRHEPFRTGRYSWGFEWFPYADDGPSYSIPLWWSLFPVLGLEGALLLHRRVTSVSRVGLISRGLCPACRYDRCGIAAGAACPECGELPRGGGSTLPARSS